MGLDGLDARQPDPRLLKVLLGLGSLIDVERALFVFGRRGVAVVRLVVEDHDVLRIAEDPADSPDHLRRRLPEAFIVAVRAGQNSLRERGGLNLLPPDEGVVVGHENRGRLEPIELVGGHEVHRPVIVAGIVRVEDPESVADRDPGGDDEEPVAEPAVLRVGGLVERLPGDEHRHQDGLAGARGHLEREPRQPAVVDGVLGADDIERLRVARLLGGLGQVDKGLGCLELAEEKAAITVFGAPMVDQVAAGRRDMRVVLDPPPLDRLADLVDDLIGLLTRRSPERVHRQLRRRLLWPSDRNEELRGSAAWEDLAGDLTVIRGREMARRLVERRVDDRVPNRPLGHVAATPHLLDTTLLRCQGTPDDRVYRRLRRNGTLGRSTHDGRAAHVATKPTSPWKVGRSESGSGNDPVQLTD